MQKSEDLGIAQKNGERQTIEGSKLVEALQQFSARAHETSPKKRCTEAITNLIGSSENITAQQYEGYVKTAIDALYHAGQTNYLLYHSFIEDVANFVPEDFGRALKEFGAELV